MKKLNFIHPGKASKFFGIAVILIAMFVVACDSGGENRSTERQETPDGVRIVSLGGDVTEIVFALGSGESVVGSDLSSTYPLEVFDLPRLNYHRQVSAEGILSLEPTIILLTEEAGPPSSIEQLRETETEVVLIPNGETADEVVPKIRAVAAALGKDEEGEKLVKKFNTEMKEVSAVIEKYEGYPAVLFLYARQGMGAPMVGGADSGANSMIVLAGGKNAAGALRGFKALTPEALLELEPDCILMMEKGYEAIGSEQGLLALPGMGDTPAGKSKNFVTLPDDLLLTFGPRTPKAIKELARALHGEGDSR